MSVNLSHAFTGVWYNANNSTIVFRNNVTTPTLASVSLPGPDFRQRQTYWDYTETVRTRSVTGTQTLQFSTFPGGFNFTSNFQGLVYAGGAIRARITGGSGYDYMHCAPAMWVGNDVYDSLGFKPMGRNGDTGNIACGQFVAPVQVNSVVRFGARYTNNRGDNDGNITVTPSTWNDSWEVIWLAFSAYVLA